MRLLFYVVPGIISRMGTAKSPTKKPSAYALGFVERGTGVEPASEAWEAPIIADILTPLKNYKEDYTISSFSFQEKFEFI